jgi:hypothetical protein
LPTYDVVLSLWEFGKRRRLWRFHGRANWLTSERLTTRIYPAIPPRESVGKVDLPAPGTEPRDVSKAPPAVVTFRDGNGRNWVRWPDGRLNRIWRY